MCGLRYRHKGHCFQGLYLKNTGDDLYHRARYRYEAKCADPWPVRDRDACDSDVRGGRARKC